MLCQDDLLFTHATNIGLTFALPHFMAQHNCEDLKPTDTPSTVLTFTKASNGHILNQICADNPCSHQVSQDKSTNSMVSPYPNSGELTCFCQKLSYFLVVLNLSIPEILSICDSVMMSA